MDEKAESGEVMVDLQTPADADLELSLDVIARSIEELRSDPLVGAWLGESSESVHVGTSDDGARRLRIRMDARASCAPQVLEKLETHLCERLGAAGISARGGVGA